MATHGNGAAKCLMCSLAAGAALMGCVYDPYYPYYGGYYPGANYPARLSETTTVTATDTPATTSTTTIVPPRYYYPYSDYPYPYYYPYGYYYPYRYIGPPISLNFGYYHSSGHGHGGGGHGWHGGGGHWGGGHWGGGHGGGHGHR